MARKISSATPPLPVVFIVVIVVFIIVALLVQSFPAKKPQEPTQTTEEAIPQQTINQGGHKSTVLSFSPTSSAETPLAKRVGDIIPLEIGIAPGENLVSFVKVDILYDPT